MATRKPKPPTTSPEADFASALDAWESENPDAGRPKTPPATEKRRAPDSELARQLQERFGTEAPSRRERRRADAQQSGGKAAAPAPRPTQQDEASARRQLTADELMREAFDAIDDRHDPTAKFRGEGYAPARDVEIIDELAPGVVEEARERLDGLDGHTDEDVAFLQLMSEAEVAPLDRSLDKLRTALDDRARWARPDAPLGARDACDQDALAAPSLTGDQRDLLRRARKQSYVPTLNLRHQRRAESMRELAAFVLQHRQERVRYVRVITGKGKQSEGPPVLKPMVMEWCSTPPGSEHVLAWAPETDRSGNFGMLVLELRR